MNGYLQISVTDTGIGIPKEKQDKLFKLFGFVQDDKQINKNGIGLGLMIAKNIVEKFDGKITFDSEKGKGSTFNFTFKLEEISDKVESIGKISSFKSNDLEFLDKTSLVNGPVNKKSSAAISTKQI
jgi:hypothetical protein